MPLNPGDRVGPYVIGDRIWAGLSRRVYGPNRTVREDQVAGTPGFWADIDIAGPGHADSKKPLPPDMKTARAILKDAGPAPTAVVSTGDGLKAWWLFTEPVMFKDAGHRWRVQD